MKQNEVKLFKILQDRSKTNVFVSNCVEEEKRKNEASFFWENEYNRSSTIEDLPLLAQTRVLLSSLRTRVLLINGKSGGAVPLFTTCFVGSTITQELDTILDREPPQLLGKDLHLDQVESVLLQVVLLECAAWSPSSALL
jgi:hypothetical protein